MPRTVHFELPARDPDKLAAFYHATFGWHVSKWGGPMDYWSVVMGGEGTPETDAAHVQPGGLSSMANMVEVDDIDAYVMKIKVAGGSVALEKQAVRGRGYVAYCQDIERNVFGLWQSDPYAA